MNFIYLSRIITVMLLMINEIKNESDFEFQEYLDEILNVNHEKDKYKQKFNHNLKYQKYYELIQSAKNNDRDENDTGEQLRNCPHHFREQIRSDLSIYGETGIFEKDIEDAKEFGVHYQIIDRKIYRSKSCLFPSRCQGIEYFLLQIKDNLTTDIEFIVNVHDWPHVSNLRQRLLPVFSFSKDTHSYLDIIYPAWSFWSGGPAIDGHPTGIGRWDILSKRIIKSSPSWNNKQSIAFFRGSRTSAERDPLIKLSKSHPTLINATYTKNQAWRSNADTLGDEPVPVISFEDQCSFKYLLNLRGVAASFRYRHLFLCKSLVLNVQSNWIEHFYSQLKPWLHYIPVKNDLTNLLEIIDFLINNDKIAEEIALNGFNFIFNHLTMESVKCYWYDLLNQYGKILRYEPKLLDTLIEIKSK